MDLVLRLGEVLKRMREAAILAVVEPHGAGILAAAPDEFVFLFALTLSEQVGPSHRNGDQHHCGEEHYHQQRVPGFAVATCVATLHAGGGPVSSSTSVAWRPEAISSTSALLLLIRNSRKRVNRVSPSATMNTSSPLVKKARRWLVFGSAT